MRRMYESQQYLDLERDASPKIVRKYREQYEQISRELDRNPVVLEIVEEDIESLSQSDQGREGKYTTENILRTIIVHVLEGTSLRETVVRVAESSTLRRFIRLGQRAVMDSSFLCRCLKVIKPETWQEINEALGRYAHEAGRITASIIRTDSTVVETNIHYPTDASLLWDSWRICVRWLRPARDCGLLSGRYCFHDRKVKRDFVYLQRYQGSQVRSRRRETRRRYVRLIAAVRKVLGIAEDVCRKQRNAPLATVQTIVDRLRHYAPLVRRICKAAEDAAVRGRTVPASKRIFSLFEEHTELIQRGKKAKPVEFGHAVWLAQTPEKFITDYEVMYPKEPDSELLDEIVQRHEIWYDQAPEVLAADRGFWSGPEEMAKVREKVEELAIPPRSPRWEELIDKVWHHFRAGIEGTISGLKRAFRLAVCVYRGFQSFAAWIGLAIFCHNLLALIPQRAKT